MTSARARPIWKRQTNTASLNATRDNTVQTLFLAAVQAYYQTLATQASFDATVISEQAASKLCRGKCALLAGSATPAINSRADGLFQATLIASQPQER